MTTLGSPDAIVSATDGSRSYPRQRTAGAGVTVTEKDMIAAPLTLQLTDEVKAEIGEN